MNNLTATQVSKIQFEKDNLIRLVREYTEVNKCTCSTWEACWSCLFTYNLHHLDSELKL